MIGCMGLPGFDGVDKGHSLPRDPRDPSKGTFEVTCGTAHYKCSGGPGYDTFAGKFPPNGNPHTYPYSPQDDKWSPLHGAREGGTAVRMFSPEQIPVKAAVAKQFGVFNKLYTAVPSASSPNHLFTQSATSCAMQTNGLYSGHTQRTCTHERTYTHTRTLTYAHTRAHTRTYTHRCGMQTNGLYNDCGGPNVSFPQKTIYDSRTPPPQPGQRPGPLPTAAYRPQLVLLLGSTHICTAGPRGGQAHGPGVWTDREHTGWLTRSLTHSLVGPRAQRLAASLASPRAHSLAHWVARSLAHSLASP